LLFWLLRGRFCGAGRLAGFRLACEFLQALETCVRAFGGGIGRADEGNVCAVTSGERGGGPDVGGGCGGEGFVEAGEECGEEVWDAVGAGDWEERAEDLGGAERMRWWREGERVEVEDECSDREGGMWEVEDAGGEGDRGL